jgi:EmrB/QacA subfamily drug resistance transporter
MPARIMPGAGRSRNALATHATICHSVDSAHGHAMLIRTWRDKINRKPQGSALADPSIPHPSDPAENLLRRRLITGACMMAIFMAAVEGTIVATAMPTIVAELGGFHLFSWVFTAYFLAQAVTTPIYGRLADLFGRKRVFFVGASIFLIGSTACGLTSSMVPLIAFRTLQGLGAGAIQSIATTIIGDIYAPAERARLQGWLSSVWGLAALIGPVLGAFIVEHLHWAFVFWINLPIGIVAIAILAIFLHERLTPRRHHIDYSGSALLMLGVGAIMMVVVQAQSLDGFVTTALLIAGTLALVLLVVNERRSREPIVPFALLRNRIIAAGSLGGLAIGALLTCVVGFLPTYVQGAMGRSPTTTGIVIAVLSVVWALASIVAGRLMVRTSYRLTGSVGALALISGCAILIALNESNSLTLVNGGAVLIGVGMGFCNTTFLVSVQASVGWSERGAATSSVLFMRTIGQALGAGIAGAILNFSLARAAPAAGETLNQLLEPSLRANLDPQTIAQLSHAIASSLHDVYVIAGVLAALTLALIPLLPAGVSPTRSGKGSGAD